MARIQTYPNDVYVTGNDKWIGSDANNDFITKNFTANAVAEYFNRVGIIDTGSFNWTYRMYAPTESQPAKTFELVDHPYDTVDVIALAGTIKVSFLTLANTEPGVFIEETWLDKIILVNRPGFPSEYGLYKVTAVVHSGDYYFLDLDFIGGNSGIINEDESVSFGLFSGVSGTSGTTGTSGTSGTTGTSGSSGVNGTSGSSGTTGTSGSSGTTGTSGSSGTNGTSGSSGTGGTSGTSGTAGSGGTSGLTGTSGTSGIDGIDGTDGTSGTTGTSGIDGTSGTSGLTGTSGIDGTSGVNGTSGINGTSGFNGTSGTDGTSGTSAIDGTSGTTGTSGTAGTSGTGGTSGVNGVSNNLFLYRARTTIQTGYPSDGHLLWNNATQINSTQINISHLTDNGIDIDIFLALLQDSQQITIQDQNLSANFQTWDVNGTPTQVVGVDNYWIVPVALISSGGTGTTNFANNHPLFLAIVSQSGTSGVNGTSGTSGTTGTSGSSGSSGTTPVGQITGSGTVNYVSKFTSASSIGNSNIQDSGSLIELGSNTTISSGSLGIGTSSLTGYNLRISKNLTGATGVYGVAVDGQIQSDATSTSRSFSSNISTAASSSTLSFLYHFAAQQSTFGAGSTVTNQYGFHVSNSLTSAVNNIAFQSDLNAANNIWNLKMAGSAQNALSGATVIGFYSGNSYSSAGTGAILTASLTNGGSGYVDGTYTNVGTTTLGTLTGQGQYSVFNITVVGGIVTSITLTWGGINYLATDTLTIPNTLLGGSGSGLVITVLTADFDTLRIQNGTSSKLSLFSRNNTPTIGGEMCSLRFQALRSVSGTTGTQAYISTTYVSTTNLGADMIFATRAASAYAVATEGMRLSSTGSLGIGATTLTGYSLRITKNITGSTTSYGIRQDGIVQSDVTGDMIGIRNDSNTAVAAFTLTNYTHFWARQGTIGAGSAITNQYGYRVDSNMIGATNNYGFYGDIPSGANRWNLYMNGTANNYLAGSLGIGTTSLTGLSLAVTKTITGATTSYGIVSNGTAQSDVTSQAIFFGTVARTQATTYTLSALHHFSASQGTFGAGSTVTTQRGFFVENTLTGATNNHGFYGDIAAGTGRYNLYMNGTAQNYLAGALSIGVTTANASALLQVDSTTKGFLPPRMTAAQRAAIATPAEGLVVVQTDGTQGLYLYIGAAWHALTML
jgi:hypothetical protein